MAIQHRRGAFNLFDPTRLLPGEWAIVLSGDSNASDGRAAYICFAAGTVKRVATFEDMAENIAAVNAQLIESLTGACAEATEDCITATGRANTAADEAEAFLEGFEVGYENLSDECIALIEQAAGTGASVITDEQGVAIIDDMATLIITGRQTGTLSDEEGLEIIDEIFI